ncbi:unnamed protein product [Lepeophtheirus salmonis]|uniref:(salmon louse) hypothetical protein n=1 Tax=Lepeophtheirus salmonis TaxID=72036 RepID=A0A7R8CUE5_LEPSM|nr:unnamed protein product [Lepeophtheirus salmonis]CAF2934123.1 unnamed protein product [Lepeophtheirus salmonis]
MCLHYGYANEVFRDCTRHLYDRVVRFEYLYYEGYWMYPYNKLRNHGPSYMYNEKEFYNANDMNTNAYRAAIHKECGGGWACLESRHKDWRFYYLAITTRSTEPEVEMQWSLNPQVSGTHMHKIKCTDCNNLMKCQLIHQTGLKKYYSTRQGYIKACASCGEESWFYWRLVAPIPSDQYRISAVSDCKRNASFAVTMYKGSSVQNTFKPYYSSVEDMAFEFKKAFEKAAELRSLTFSQQWTMSDDSIYNKETSVQMGLFNVPPAKKFSIRQLHGTYGPFLIKKTAHYDIYQESC